MIATLLLLAPAALAAAPVTLAGDPPDGGTPRHADTPRDGAAQADGGAGPRDQDGQDLAGRVQALERRNAELEQRIDALADEQESLDLGGLVPPIGARHSGLAPVASKVYGIDRGLSIGGYGEFLYTDDQGGANELDTLRTVFYFGYRFDEQWVLNVELELEHAGEEVATEFATLDYLFAPELNARAGLVLVPMGFLNEEHEPNTFLAALRPETETRILPTTWRESGAGVYGDLGPISYRAYVIDGLDARGFTADGLRGGRQEGSEALADDLAVVARADWTAVPGLVAGVSGYRGNAGQGQSGLGNTATTIAEGHAEWRAMGWWLRGLAAFATVDDVAALNAAGGLTGDQSVGEELDGWYLEAGYDLLGALAPDTNLSLYPYVRYESIDTQADVPSGFASADATSSDITTFGLHFRPIDSIVIKLDYQAVDGGGDDRWNLLVGYSF